MSLFKRWNNIVGWAVFAIAAITYLMTMEPVASLWDCSEFIATSYKLEVGHPPGAPLFMLLARIATLFAPSPEYVGTAVNTMNSLASAFCILFLFWSITHLARRLMTHNGRELTLGNTIAIIGAGAVGALAYTFTDTFWFSAIEGEVYALSSMFTALVLWLMLKWEDDADNPHSSRWIVLIAYLMGLSIGVHILNLLTIPALVLIYYFRKTETVTAKGLAIAILIAGACLLAINGIIIPYTVYLGAMVDLLFVNAFGLPVNSGITVFALALIGGIGYAAWYTYRKNRPTLNTILVALLMIFIGYSSYASMTIRAVANPPMNSNNPNNPHALLSVLNRDQYGSRPLLMGAQYSALPSGYKYKTVYYLNEEGTYSKDKMISGYEYSSDFITLFPRIWNSSKGAEQYKPWAAYRTKTEAVRDERGQIVVDETGRPVYEEVFDFGRKRTISTGEDVEVIVEPTSGENLNFFFNYQLNYMYWRYFLWNFVGRQSDAQATESAITDGNWLSGIKFIDEMFLGPQENLPTEMANNKGRNTYFFLPFILGLIGLLYQLNRDQRNFSIVMLLFLMTGIALVLYFNTSPNEPRERDYVYAASFYAFCIWIGLGVLALYELLTNLTKQKSTTALAACSIIICSSVPIILAAQNWDDHDRSGRYMARDIGWNYLQSTLPNSIILNYGDNDTFPLWYNQEVLDTRLDVRIMNTSYLGADWYIDEMKMRSYDAPGVPFSLPMSKYTHANDMVPVVDRVDRPITLKQAIDFVKSDDERTQVPLGDGSTVDYIPSKRLLLPVNKENVIASGIVKEADRDLIVDTITLGIPGNYLNKSELMLLDMLANFDWKRPIYMTQSHILRDLGLTDYLQFDGYAYRLVPIKTPITSVREIGRIDTDYVLPLLNGEGENSFRFGNLADSTVYVDSFIRHNLNASSTREAFARTAKELISQERLDEAVSLLDRGLALLPSSQVGYNDRNTVPFIEGYYMAGLLGKEAALESGDKLLLDYARNIQEYIDYYLQFEGVQADMVALNLDSKIMDLNEIYYLANSADRKDVINTLNDYYRTLGLDDSELIDTTR